MLELDTYWRGALAGRGSSSGWDRVVLHLLTADREDLTVSARWQEHAGPDTAPRATARGKRARSFDGDPSTRSLAVPLSDRSAQTLMGRLMERQHRRVGWVGKRSHRVDLQTSMVRLRLLSIVASALMIAYTDSSR